MAYTPKTWQCDDTITADELNRMEQGIAEASQGGGGTLVVRVASTRPATTEECADGGTVTVFDKTWQEIRDALESGVCVVIILSTSSTGVSATHAEEAYFNNESSDYEVRCMNGAFYSSPTSDGSLLNIYCGV